MFNFYKLLEAAKEPFIIFKDTGLNSNAIGIFKLGESKKHLNQAGPFLEDEKTREWQLKP